MENKVMNKEEAKEAAKVILDSVEILLAVLDVKYPGNKDVLLDAMVDGLMELAGRHKVCSTEGTGRCPDEKDIPVPDGRSFGSALSCLKNGLKVARKGWNGKGIYLELQRPDAHSKMTLPYIYIVTGGLVTDNPHAPKGTVPWLASQTDMLAEDWYVVK